MNGGNKKPNREPKFVINFGDDNSGSNQNKRNNNQNNKNNQNRRNNQKPKNNFRNNQNKNVSAESLNDDLDSYFANRN